MFYAEPLLNMAWEIKTEAVFEEIQCSNMSKLDENDKVIKGSNYFRPNIAKIFKG